MRNRLVRGALFAAAGLAFASPAAAVTAGTQILVLSNRADLVSGGNALVEIRWPPGVNLALAKISVDGVNVKPAFAMRPNGRYMGVVSGLKNGNNVMSVRIPGGGAQMTIKNHPIGGPVFSGEQLQPWICAYPTATPVNVTVPGTSLSAMATSKLSGLDGPPTDAQCNAPTKFTYYYMPSSGKNADCTFTFSATAANSPARCFDPYAGPASRPADSAIADFTNDRGDMVKALIRVERGTINRGIYELVTFFDPAVPSAPWAPQKGWNGKLLWKFGAASSYSRFQNPTATSVNDDFALRKGYMIAVSSLTDHSLNANDTLGAETVMMVKERITETYGQIRFTIGNGCSGGSIFQYQLAAAYPGLLDGIQPTCTYPDTFSTGIEVVDCGLLGRRSTEGGTTHNNYYASPNGLLLSAAERAAINGHTNPNACLAWIVSFLNNANPSGNNCGAGFPTSLIYDAATRPDGVRCTGSDHAAGMLGKFIDTDGNSKSPSPFDNIGVQYGLKALTAGAITTEQFVQLNEGIGSFTMDAAWAPPARKAAGNSVLQTVYSGGIVSDGKQLAKTAIIDLRGNQTAADIHQNWRAFQVRSRLDKANGHHDNQVIWGYGGGGAGAVGAYMAQQSLLRMEQWLANIESDPSANPIEVKVVNNKPADLVDRCITTTGASQAQFENTVPFGSPACGSTTYQNPPTLQSSPRQVAGGPLSEDVFKCQLKAFDPASADYNGVVFTPEQQGRLALVFPTGVCDWSLPGVEQVPANPWTTFSAGPGGQPLPPPPVSKPFF